MVGDDVEALVKEVRHRALTGGVDELVADMDELLARPMDPAERGQVLIARAVALQGLADPTGPALDAADAARLLRSAGRITEAAYASAAAAAFTQRAGQLEESVDHAVTAMVLQSQSADDSDVVRSANGLAILFGQLSAFRLAVESGSRAFLGSANDPIIREIAAYTLCFLVVEARHGEVDVDVDIACEAARWLNGQAETDAARLAMGPGMLVELALLGEVAVDVVALTAELESHLDLLAPRLRAWAELVLGSVARRDGDPVAAIGFFDLALSVLVDIGDEHRVVRAYRERAEARAALGDIDGAYADAREALSYVRRNQLDLVGQLSTQIQSRAEVEIARAALRRRADDLAREAATDALTGVGSRRWIENLLDQLQLEEGDGAVVILDLDHFKSVNDRFGHHVGDLTLSTVGEILKRVLRSDDHVGRLGGEEFVVILPDATAGAAADLAERVRREVATAPWHKIDPDLKVTTSAGVATGPLSSIRDVVRAADAALYDAKAAGRNRVIAA